MLLFCQLLWSSSLLLAITYQLFSFIVFIYNFKQEKHDSSEFCISKLKLEVIRMRHLHVIFVIESRWWVFCCCWCVFVLPNNHHKNTSYDQQQNVYFTTACGWLTESVSLFTLKYFRLFFFAWKIRKKKKSNILVKVNNC